MRSIIVTDLGFGDSGKGTIVDSLVGQYDSRLVVRYNGGAQAAHAVVNGNTTHVFNQFSSGTFHPGVETYLSRHMMVNPEHLFWEDRNLQFKGVYDALVRLFIHEEALIITPFHIATNQIKEFARFANAHGSCGQGIGETMSDSLIYPAQVLRFKDLYHPEALRRKMKWHMEGKQVEVQSIIDQYKDMIPAEVQSMLYPTPEVFEANCEIYEHMASLITMVDDEWFKRRSRAEGTIIFEGAQGVLLDEDYGFHPHTTWSKTTPVNALQMLSEVGYGGDITKVGVVRAYHTRHGSGPFPTYDYPLSSNLQDTTNPTNNWQGNFRVGWFDENLAKYAQSVANVDILAMTNLDRIPRGKLGFTWVCNRYILGSSVWNIPNSDPSDFAHREAVTKWLGEVIPSYRSVSCDSTNYAQDLAESLQIPLGITSSGPAWQDKEYTSEWEALMS